MPGLDLKICSANSDDSHDFKLSHGRHEVSEPPGVSGLDGTWKLGPIDLAAGMLGSGGGTATLPPLWWLHSD